MDTRRARGSVHARRRSRISGPARSQSERQSRRASTKPSGPSRPANRRAKSPKATRPPSLPKAIALPSCGVGRFWLAPLAGGAATMLFHPRSGVTRRRLSGRRMDRSWRLSATASTTVSLQCTTSMPSRCPTWIPASIATAIRFGRPTAGKSRSAARRRVEAGEAVAARMGGRVSHGRFMLPRSPMARPPDLDCRPGSGSAFHGIVSENQLYWGAGDRMRLPVGERRLVPPLFRRRGRRPGKAVDAR